MAFIPMRSFHKSPSVAILLASSCLAGCASTGTGHLASHPTTPDPMQPGAAAAGTEVGPMDQVCKPTASVELASFHDDINDLADGLENVSVDDIATSANSKAPVQTAAEERLGSNTGTTTNANMNLDDADFGTFQEVQGVPSMMSIQGGESIQEAWAIAVAVNEKVRSKQNVTGAAVYTHEAAKSARMPSLRTFNAYTALDNTPGLSVSIPGVSALPFGSLPIGEKDFFASATLASVPLYTSGKISSAINASAANVNASKFDQRSGVHDLKMEVAEAYVRVLKTEKLVEVARLSVETLEKHLIDVQDLFDEDVVSKADVLAVKTALSESRDKYLEATNGLDLANAAYNRLVGRQLDQPVMLAELIAEGLPISSGPEELAALAMAQRSELKAIACKSNALRHQAKQELAATGPQVGALGGFHFLENSNLTHEDIWSVGIAAEWTVFDGGMAKNKAAAFKQQASALARLQRDLRSQIALQVRQAWLSMQNAAKRMEVAQTSVEQAEESLRVALDRYREEVGTNTEVLDAQTLLASRRSSFYAATYDAALARIMLDRATGTI
ncbi:TolC family protein [Neorhodopirellula lusitana]|nr:TolC family protein [Neorhodopirellula lusitana]